MEIIKEGKPDNEIAYIEELNIPKVDKEPLAIEYLDYLSIIVDQKLKAERNNLKCIIQERDAIELLSLEKESNNVEYIDEILIEGFDRPNNEIQLIDQID